jgi:N utilization substance protein B
VDIAGDTFERALREYFQYLASAADGREFATTLVEGFAARAEDVDAVIRKVSEHWRLERMPRVDRNILRLGTYELMYMRDVPRRVTLNEAVELAKRYGSEGSAGFVNGVLDRIATDLGKA